jgi:hypothetical protein
MSKEKNAKDLITLEADLVNILAEIKEVKGDLVKEIEYKLLEPVKYSHNGSFKETCDIMLKAPKGKHIDEVQDAIRDGVGGVLKLVGNGELMFCKDSNSPIHYAEFNDMDARVLSGLAGFYVQVFFPFF